MYYIRMNTCEPIKDETYCSNHCERENGPKINDGTGRFKHDWPYFCNAAFFFGIENVGKYPNAHTKFIFEPEIERGRDGVAEVNDAKKVIVRSRVNNSKLSTHSIFWLHISIATITPTIIYNFMWDSIFSVVFTQSIEQKSTVSIPFVSLYIFANKFILPRCTNADLIWIHWFHLKSIRDFCSIQGHLSRICVNRNLRLKLILVFVYKTNSKSNNNAFHLIWNLGLNIVFFCSMHFFQQMNNWEFPIK